MWMSQAALMSAESIMDEGPITNATVCLLVLESHEEDDHHSVIGYFLGCLLRHQINRPRNRLRAIATFWIFDAKGFRGVEESHAKQLAGVDEIVESLPEAAFNG